jgi:hypothetical protein
MPDDSNSPVIVLTLAVQGREYEVKLWQMLTYDQQIGFTRLRLSGGRNIDVKETTGEIDQLVRLAATRSTIPLSASQNRLVQRSAA